MLIESRIFSHKFKLLLYQITPGIKSKIIRFPRPRTLGVGCCRTSTFYTLFDAFLFTVESIVAFTPFVPPKLYTFSISKGPCLTIYITKWVIAPREGRLFTWISIIWLDASLPTNFFALKVVGICSTTVVCKLFTFSL